MGLAAVTSKNSYIIIIYMIYFVVTPLIIFFKKRKISEGRVKLIIGPMEPGEKSSDRV